MKNLLLALSASLLLVSCSHHQWTYGGWTAPYDQWIGRWNGPEGTYLDIEPHGATYKMTIANLDGPVVYYGTPVSGGLEFYRGNKMEFLHAGSGADTGMKWLADKKKCLVVTTGEGYCRD